MKKVILFGIILFTIVGFSSTTNKDGRILYVFPDDVEIALNNYMEQLKNANKDLQFSLTLYKENDNEYRIFVNQYEKSKRSMITSADIVWLELSNRYVIINDNEYPLLFDYDYDFSTTKPSEIGEFGKREGMILRTTVINEGFSIKFNKSGVIP